MSETITVVVPLRGLPEVPELFRPVEQPLGLCPFPLTTVGLLTKMLANPELLTIS